MEVADQEDQLVERVTKWIDAGRDDPVTEVAVASLRSRLEPVQAYLVLAAKNYQDDIEHVHRLRVWTRRAGAAIELYRELLPERRTGWIEKQLRRIRKATNDARDDDVMAQRLAGDERPAAGKLLQQVRDHRELSQQSVVEIYQRLTNKKGRFNRRVAKLLQRVRLRGRFKSSSEPSYRAWAEVHLAPIVSEFFQLGQGNLRDAEDLHRFRIVGKKLRYAMELLSAAFDSELREKAYPLLANLQDQLGKINDHASACKRIDKMIAENIASKPAEFLREMASHEQAAFGEARSQFDAWWTTRRQKQMRDAFDRALRD